DVSGLHCPVRRPWCDGGVLVTGGGDACHVPVVLLGAGVLVTAGAVRPVDAGHDSSRMTSTSDETDTMCFSPDARRSSMSPPSRHQIDTSRPQRRPSL